MGRRSRAGRRFAGGRTKSSEYPGAGGDVRALLNHGAIALGSPRQRALPWRGFGEGRMVRSGRPDGADGQQSLGELVALAAKDMSSLIRYEISLAKSEFKLDARRIAIVAAIGVVALFVLCLIVVLLCFAYAYGLVAAFA